MPTLFDLYGIDLGQPEEPPPPKSGLIRRAVGDTAVTAVKSAIGLPEFAVGLADIVTGGRVGKALENEGGTVGFRPKQTREYLDTLYSPEQQAANREVQQAEGFFDTAAAALRNPSTIFHAVLESAPSMLPAAGIARGVMAGAQRLSPTLAGRIAAAEAAPLVASQGAKTAAELTRLAAIGIGDGVVSAGASAEQIRQQTEDGLLTAEQSGIAAVSGGLTGLIGGVAGKIANKLGIGDVQQLIAGVQQAGPQAQKALSRAMLEGFATEGILQELPQSAQEQIAQNVALGKPWDEGVGNAAAMGALAGGVMGGGVAAFTRRPTQPEPQPDPVDPLTESNARADAAMERLATTNDVGQMIDAAREIATATPLSITEEQEARVMQAGEELAKADLTDMKNMGRLDRTPTRGVEQPAPIVPASAEGPAPFLDRLLTATEALQDPAVRQRVEQAAGPQYLAQLDQYAEVANTPGVMDGVGDQVRERFLGLMERAVFPDRFRQPAPPVQRAERRKSDPVPIEPFRAPPVTDPVLDYVEAKRAENTMAARAFVKEFEAGRITRRDVVRVMQDRNADPLGSNPDPLASIQPATPAPNLVQQRLEAAARAGQAQPTGIQIEPSRARPKGQSDERNPERAVPGEGRPVDAGSQPGTSGVVSGELQQPGAPGPAGTPVPSAVQGVDAERAGRGLGDDALSGGRVAQLAAVFKRVADEKLPGRDNAKTAQNIAAELAPLIDAKNADALIARNLGSADMNPASRAVFEAATGIKLPKGRAATEAAIDQWAGVTPEIRAEREAKRKALRESEKAGEASKFARQAAERIHVNTPDGQITGGAYVDDLIAKGFDRIVARGPKTFLANSDGNGFPLPNVDLAGYARKAVAARATSSAQAQAVKEALAGDRQPFEHAGLKVYPTKMRRDGAVVDAWAVQLPENKGTDKVLGDTLHTTIEAAKESAEYEAKRESDRKQWERKDQEEAAKREAAKEANRGKSVAQRAADFSLNQPNKLPPSAGLGTGTRRDAMDKAVEQGRAIRAETVEDTAAKNRDKKAVEAVSKAGYLLGLSNENIPVVKAGLEARDRLKADKYPKIEYRVYGGRLAEGPFHTITKTEHDYANALTAEKAATPNAAAPASTQAPAQAGAPDLSKNGGNLNTSAERVQKAPESEQVAAPVEATKAAPPSTPELQAYMAASAEVTRLETALIDLRSDTRIKPKGRDEWLRKIGALERDLAAAKAERERAGRVMREGKAQTPAPAPMPPAALTPEKRQELQDARQMVEDMIATKRANREAVPDAWVKRLADLSAQQRGENANDGAVYSLEVEGHPLYDSRPVLRNLVPIKVSSVADAQRKLDNALDLERKVATEFYGAQQAMRAAKTAAQKKAAQARLTALNNQGWDADSLKDLRDTTIGELSRLLDTATERFGGASPTNDLPEPTEAQKEAGNYRVGRIKVAGLDISVENPAGSERSGIDPDGKKWRNTLAHHYGYLRNTSGADGDHVDVFVNPGTPEDYDGQVFVVDQADPKTGRFDEHKVMMGFPSAKAAQEAYQANYAKDWTGLRAVQPMTMEQFKAWVSDPANTKKPAAKGVKPGKGEKVERPDELVELRKRESALKSLRECLG